MKILTSLAHLVLHRVAADAPRVLVSLDTTWVHRVAKGALTYQRMLRRAGLRPVVVDHRQLDKRNDVRALLDEVCGLVLGGGGDVDPALYEGDPSVGVGVKQNRDRFEALLYHEAVARGYPVLGICRGSQLINVLSGGTLTNLRGDRISARSHRTIEGHTIEIVKGTHLERIMGAEALPTVFTWHGQSVCRLGANLRVSATAEDGTIEAIECPDLSMGWVVGVQWHPEVQLRRRPEHQLVEAFAAAVVQRQNRVVSA